MRSNARYNAWVNRRANARDLDAATTEPRAHSLRRIDSSLLVAFAALLGAGLVMVYSASAPMSNDLTGHSAHYLYRQLWAAVLGLLGGWAVMQIPPKRLARHANKVLIAALVLMLCVYVPFISKPAGGFRRWIGFGPFTFQPIELAKFAVVLYVARFLSRGDRHIRSLTRGVLPTMMVTLLFVTLLILQPDFGSGALLCMIVFVMLLIGGARIIHLALLGSLAAFPAYVLIVSNPYRMGRVMTFLNLIGGPTKTTEDASYQISQSYNALTSGELFGVGPGRSNLKQYYLPETHTDFIFSIVGEELGFIGAAGIILLFFWIVARGFRIAMGIDDRFCKMLACGITVSIGLQAFVNIAMTLGLLPTKGFTLPLLSYGGSSLMVSVIQICILLNISRYMRRRAR